MPEAHGEDQKTHGEVFAVRHTRQRAHGGEMHGKELFAVCPISGRTVKTMGGTRSELTTVDGDGESLPCVAYSGTR